LLIGILIVQLVCVLFSIAWWLVGQVWVFGAQANGFQSTNSNQTTTYCNATLFWNSFALIIVFYAILLILILVCGGRFIMKHYKIKQGAAPKIDERS
jgi:predicted membrane protein